MWIAIAVANVISQERDTPMTLHRITTIAAYGESETLEFKAATGTRREAAMTVCAFLNQRGDQVRVEELWRCW